MWKHNSRLLSRNTISTFLKIDFQLQSENYDCSRNDQQLALRTDQLMLLQLTKGKADSDIYKRFGYCIWNR